MSFSKVSKAEWLAKVERDLKGKSLSALNWQIGDDLNVSPFAHAEDGDFGEFSNYLRKTATDNSWQIGEDILVKTAKDANAQLLNSLAAGVNSPRLILKKKWSKRGWHTLLKGVNLDFISLHLHEQFQPTDAEKTLKFLAHHHSSLKGSFQTESENRATTIRFAHEHLKNFRTFFIDATPYYGNVMEELVQILEKLDQEISRLTKAGLSVDTLQPQLQIKLAVGKSYLLEISKIRALKILVANLFAAHGATEVSPPFISTYFDETEQADQKYHDMIGATTQAMSAIIGGSDRLTVALPHSANDFQRRIARNVQHLLALESRLDRVEDPAAGSYYVDSLTEQLMEQAWAGFLKKNS